MCYSKFAGETLTSNLSLCPFIVIRKEDCKVPTWSIDKTRSPPLVYLVWISVMPSYIPLMISTTEISWATESFQKIKDHFFFKQVVDFFIFYIHLIPKFPILCILSINGPRFKVTITLKYLPTYLWLSRVYFSSVKMGLFVYLLSTSITLITSISVALIISISSSLLLYYISHAFFPEDVHHILAISRWPRH